jgi:hypothetical protein
LTSYPAYWTGFFRSWQYQVEIVLLLYRKRCADVRTYEIIVDKRIRAGLMSEQYVRVAEATEKNAAQA